MTSRILPFLALVISVAIFFAYVMPNWNGSIAAKNLAIQNDDQALAAAAAYKARETQLAAAMNAIDPTDLTKLSTFLPDAVDDVGLILDVNALAARSGLLLSNIDVAADANNASASSGSTSSGTPTLPAATALGSADLSLSAVGTYAALQAFLAGIEQSERVLDVHDITVTGSATGVYNYQMTMRLYWLQ